MPKKTNWVNRATSQYSVNKTREGAKIETDSRDYDLLIPQSRWHQHEIEDFLAQNRNYDAYCVVCGKYMGSRNMLRTPNPYCGCSDEFRKKFN